jgi:glutaredoxin
MKLELYHFESCPYCRKVRDAIDSAGIKSKITYHDTDKDEKAHERLMKMTGDDQVPCLVIDGKPMLESDDIIDWLKANVKAYFKKLSPLRSGGPKLLGDPVSLPRRSSDDFLPSRKFSHSFENSISPKTHF